MQQPSLLDWTPPDPYPAKGDTFDQARDGKRLGDQAQRVYDLMKDGKRRTLSTIADEAQAPEASVSARLRDIRRMVPNIKVQKQHLGNGLWTYWLERT